ncbi:MAG: DNRLRE domain-containing protein [Pirellulales bacterium]|nr:DNRLRE domain-containing protein [Pirellulales bacterium]
MRSGFGVAVAVALLAAVAQRGAAAVVVLKPDPVAGKDAQLIGGIDSATNSGAFPYLITNIVDNARSIGLIEFALGIVPAGSTINSATLSLLHSLNRSLNSQYDIFRVTSSWDESTVTFNTAPTFDPVAASSLTIPDSSVDLYRNWNVTGLVQGWVDGTYSNFGMWIEEIPVQGSATAFFRSSDSSEQFRPILTIDYTPGAVPEPAALAIWSLLGVFGLVAAWRRHKRAA